MGYSDDEKNKEIKKTKEKETSSIPFPVEGVLCNICSSSSFSRTEKQFTH